MMRFLVGLVALVLIAVILWDAFETVVLPRRVVRRVRWARYVSVVFWTAYSACARRIRGPVFREAFLSYYGPLSVLVLLATWAAGLILGFGLLNFALGSRLADPLGKADFGTDLYMSGTTFFTLGLGDVVPRSRPERALAVIEAGLGFAFLAMVVSYLPVLYQSFSRREVRVSLLDAWAGSPPTAGELLRRLQLGGQPEILRPFLEVWELWSAELLEAIMSYPPLAYFRSQHNNQHWLTALTMILDASALAVSSVDGVPTRTAFLTFAMARHAIVDLCQILNAPPRPLPTDRLPPSDLERLRAMLREAGAAIREDPASEARLRELRALYESYVYALSQRLLVSLPPWMSAPGARDNWQRTPWR
jgi:voltage-gated potassium channel Kch